MTSVRKTGGSMRRRLFSAALLAGLLAPAALLAGSDQVQLLDVKSTGGSSGGISQGVLRVGAEPWKGPNTTVTGGKTVYRARADETLRGIAQRVYGDPNMWRLIWNANRERLMAGGASAGSIDLVIPPPPSARIFRRGDQVFVEVLPGDTFAGLAQALYGRADYWPLLYQANRNLIESPATAQALMRTGGQASLLFVVPPPGSAVTSGSPNLPQQVQSGTVPANYQQTPAADQGRMAATGRRIASLNLSGPNAIGRAEAEIILRDCGFICSRNPTFERAMGALGTGYYQRGRSTLDAKSREWLFQQYTWYRQALSRYGQYPTISAQATPDLYKQWVREAAQQLTAVPAAQREKLMLSLMTTESGRTQWTNFTPVVSNCGAIGFGQFLPATAAGTHINPYDPKENILGIAKYLNGLIKKHGNRKGLACYNGGGNPPSSSYAYADRILSRAGMA